MFRTAPLRRFIAGICGVWLLLVLLEPLPLHACPMHGGHTATPMGSPTAMTMAGHQHHVMPTDHKPTSKSKACTCLGECAGVVAVRLSSSPELTFAPAVVRDVAVPDEPVGLAVDTHLDLRLPPAHAPPVLSVA